MVVVPAFAVTITVDGSSEHQVIDGFGTSVMNWMSAEYGNAEARRIYAQDMGGSIVRGELHPQAITKGPMNLNPTVFGPDIDANAALMDFTGQSRVSITGGFAQAVYNQRIDEMKVMLSIWTPPHWMKENAQFVEPGPQSYGGYLIRTEANRTNFARYVAAWVKGFSETYQIPVDVLSVQNELDWAHSPATWTTSCQYHSTNFPAGSPGYNTYNPAVRAVYNELKANNISLEFAGPEKSHIFENDYNLGGQLSYIHDMATDGTMDIMDIFCHHGYALRPGNRAMIKRYWDAVKQHGKRSWQTEAGHFPINWSGAMSLARNIQDELVAGDLSGYIAWCFNAGSGNDEYALVLNTTQKTDKYYAFKHFSRYIRPGAIRLGCSPDDPNGLSVSAYRHHRNGTLTIVLINAGGGQNATINLPQDPSGISSFRVFTSREGSRWVESQASVSGGSVNVAVPGNGFVTLYGEGAVSTRPSERAPGAATPVQIQKHTSILQRSPTAHGVRISVPGRNGSAGLLFDLRGRRGEHYPTL